jgi:hypothetical protein
MLGVRRPQIRSMRQIQEWMGHRDYRTTLIYTDYEPGDNESGMIDRAFSLTTSVICQARVPSGTSHSWRSALAAAIRS